MMKKVLHILLVGLLPAVVLAADDEPIKAKAYNRGQYIYHVSQEVGSAGNPDWTWNNSIDFDIGHTGRKAILYVTASPDEGTSTFGLITLTSPSGVQYKIHSWNPSTFKYVKGFKYEDLKPVKFDLTSVIKERGTYNIRYDYTKGTYRLVIVKTILEILK